MKLPKKYVIWVFKGGYRHGFETSCENWRDDEIIHEYGHVKPDKTLKNQGDYLDACVQYLGPIVAIREYPWTDEGLMAALNRDDLRIYDDYGGWLDPDDEDDAVDIAKVGGLAAWATEHGVETFGYEVLGYLSEGE